MPLIRINLSNSQEGLDDFEMGLTYKTPTESESFEKWRETLREFSEG